MPNEVCGLTALNKLWVWYPEKNIFCIHDIKSLRQARLRLQGSVVFQPQLSRLHSLEALKVDMSCLSEFDLRFSSIVANRTCVCAEFRVDWADMATLQSSTICKGCVKFGPQVMGLSALRQLRFQV